MKLEKLLTPKNIERGSIPLAIIAFAAAFLVSKPSEEEPRQSQQVPTETKLEVEELVMYPKEPMECIIPQDLIQSPAGRDNIDKWARFLKTYHCFGDLISRVESEHYPLTNRRGEALRDKEGNILTTTIPVGTLAGLVMHESGGDAISVGQYGDAGITMLLSGTAHHFGLNSYNDERFIEGNSQYSILLKRLVKQFREKPQYLASLDERFDPEKALRASAEYLAYQFSRYRRSWRSESLTWQMAISAYNRGHSAANPALTGYVQAVESFRAYYNSKKSD